MTPVLIMAGGRGLRLHPLTETKPKPLIKVGSKPILQTIIEGFVSQGFRRIWLSVNYKAHLIKDYFKDGSEIGAKIKYIDESEPLGTGGAVCLLPAFQVPFIVCNGDVLTKVAYGRLMEAHARSNCLATVCAALHQQQIHFGVIDQEEGRLIDIREKPIENFAVNAGIYVVEPDAVKFAPEGAFDMPDLLGRLPKDGERSRVSVFPLEEHWIDIGRFEDLAKATAEWAA